MRPHQAALHRPAVAGIGRRPVRVEPVDEGARGDEGSGRAGRSQSAVSCPPQAVATLAQADTNRPAIGLKAIAPGIHAQIGQHGQARKGLAASARPAAAKRRWRRAARPASFRRSRPGTCSKPLSACPCWPFCACMPGAIAFKPIAGRCAICLGKRRDGLWRA